MTEKGKKKTGTRSTGTRPAGRAPAPAKTMRETDGYSRVRSAHKQEQAEDYVELVAALISEKGEARAVDMARALGVSHVTVIRTLARLQKLGLIRTEPYRAIFLTDEGRKLAEMAYARHQVVRDFLLAIGVPEAVAEIDAEGIEHHVSPETLEAFRRVISAGAKKAP